MPGLIPEVPSCCDPCEEPVSVAVPGPQGPAGTNGTNGTNGVDAFTTASLFVMPAELANVTVVVGDSTWMTAGQIVFAAAGGAVGYFEVVSKPTSTSVTLKNLEDTASDAYLSNSPPGTNFPNGTQISPAGLQGERGTDGASGAPVSSPFVTFAADGTLTGEFNLGSLLSGMLKHAVAAGTSTPATAVDGTDYLSPLTGLKPTDIGSSVQAFDAGLQSLSAFPTVADRIAYSTAVNVWAEAVLTAFARLLIASATAAAARVQLNVLAGYGLIGSVTGVDLNAGAADTPVVMLSANYIVDAVVATNSSISLTTATVGVFNTAGGVGTIAADQAVSALTAAIKFHELTISSVGATDRQTAAQLFVRCGTPQGAAATADFYIFGRKFD